MCYTKPQLKRLWKVVLSVVVIIGMAACHQNPKKTDYLHETPEAYAKRMEWWKDARFGMFIHWGVYSVPAGIYHGKEVPGIGEWIMNNAHIPVKEYESFARQFNPVDFDADRWVSIAKQAGMKYMVITSKHHDGFCLWDTKLTNYNIVDYTPYGKDILKQLSVACKKAGMHLGFYYSIMDWHNPDAHGDRFPVYYEKYLKPQIKELLTNYGDIDILWFDGEWIDEWTEEEGRDLYNYVRSLNPDIIINNRVGKGRMGMQGMNKGEGYVGDFGTPEQGILDQKSDFSWETCMTMNDTWGFKKNDHDWKSTKVLIDNLIDISSKGGNYLLNVGPDSKGVIPEASVIRLKEIGKWMNINGEAMYGTRAFTFSGEDNTVRYTQSKNGKTVFALLTKWPGTSLKLTAVQPENGAPVYLLGEDTPLQWSLDGSKDMIIQFPRAFSDSSARPCDYAWTVTIRGKAYPLLPPPQMRTGTGETGDKVWFKDPVYITIADSAKSDEMEIRYTLDGSDPTNMSQHYTHPIQVRQSELIKARLFVYEDKASFISQMQCINSAEEKIPVVYYTYYEGEWDSLPVYSSLHPIRSGWIPGISLSYVHPRDNGFGVVFTGNIRANRAGTYTFALTSDDGSRLFVNNTLLIDHDGVHGFDEKQADINLDKGIYPFRIEYFEATGGNGIRVRVKMPGEASSEPLRNIVAN